MEGERSGCIGNKILKLELTGFIGGLDMGVQGAVEGENNAFSLVVSLNHSQLVWILLMSQKTLGQALGGTRELKTKVEMPIWHPCEDTKWHYIGAQSRAQERGCSNMIS